MSDADDLEDLDDLDGGDRTGRPRRRRARSRREETELDRTRTAYTGARLDDEFQPVDEVELAEEGMLLDDPEHPSRRRRDLDPDDAGWDLDDEG